ncbi:hypothetical protein FQR65_LT18419 [Abscondita terminalis]|nr:hypothetical protein FQR65_LT18419 [Abscondita terminalis]
MEKAPRPGPRPASGGKPAAAHRLGLHDLRPRAEPDVHRHGQWLALDRPSAGPGGGATETPGDSWDFTSTQPMVLADIKGGRQAAQGHPCMRPRRLFLRHDRTNGAASSSRPKNFVMVNWASATTAKGRPIETPIASQRRSVRRDVIPPALLARTNWASCPTPRPAGLTCRPACAADAAGQQ